MCPSVYRAHSRSGRDLLEARRHGGGCAGTGSQKPNRPSSGRCQPVAKVGDDPTLFLTHAAVVWCKPDLGLGWLCSYLYCVWIAAFRRLRCISVLMQITSESLAVWILREIKATARGMVARGREGFTRSWVNDGVLAGAGALFVWWSNYSLRAIYISDSLLRSAALSRYELWCTSDRWPILDPVNGAHVSNTCSVWALDGFLGPLWRDELFYSLKSTLLLDRWLVLLVHVVLFPCYKYDCRLKI